MDPYLARLLWEKLLNPHFGEVFCNEEAVLLDSNAALLNNKGRSDRQGSEAIIGVA